MSIKDGKAAPGYKSPISVSAEEVERSLVSDIDEKILHEVRVVVDVNKDELLKALANDRGQYYEGYRKGYLDGYKEGRSELAKRIARITEEAEE